MAIHIIVAVSENGIIGKNNALIWNLPDDMRHFVRSTKGHPVIMGRKTFESMDGPLPKRTNIIITRNSDYSAGNTVVTHSLEDALEKAAELDEDLYVIGGAEIYRQAEPLSDVMHITRVHSEFEGDSSFEIQRPEDWKLMESEFHDVDDRHAHQFTIERYERIG